MIWIDRLAVVWALFVLLACLAAGPTPGHFDSEVVKGVLVLAGGPWLVLRGLHFVVFGVQRWRI